MIFITSYKALPDVSNLENNDFEKSHDIMNFYCYQGYTIIC